MKNRGRNQRFNKPTKTAKSVNTTPDDTGALIWRNCTIGALDAETDGKLLASCYVDNGCLEAIRDVSSPQSIILGRTGAGKSAAMIRLAQLEPRVVVVEPLELAFKHIENSTVITFFQKAGVNLDLFYRLLWRHVLITELLKSKYGLRDRSSSVGWLDSLFARVRGDVTRERALRYLRQWGDEFWLTTETRMKEVTQKVEAQLKGSIEGSAVLAKASAGIAETLSDSERREVVTRGSEIINGIQLRELSELLDFLNNDVFCDSQKIYFLAIDKLDEEWVTSVSRSRLIRALIEEIKAFRKVVNVKIIIVLRDDLLEKVYDETRDGGFQQEKYEAYYARVRWTDKELVELIDKRINEVFKHKYANIKMQLMQLFPKDRETSAIGYILERTFDRPRDVISYINQCLLLAEGRPRISWHVIREAEEQYSKGRLKSLFDEWLASFPSLSRVADLLLGIPESFTRSALSEVSLNDLATALAERGFSDEVGKLCESLLSPESRKTTSELAWASLRLLYHTGIVGVKLAADAPFYWSYKGGEELTYGDMKRATTFRVHKMFWRALHVKTSQQWNAAID
jgi:hypothetical protein